MWNKGTKIVQKGRKNSGSARKQRDKTQTKNNNDSSYI